MFFPAIFPKLNVFNLQANTQTHLIEPITCPPTRISGNCFNVTDAKKTIEELKAMVALLSGNFSAINKSVSIAPNLTAIG